MSFLKIGDRAAGAIKSGGTTRRAAKMVVLDLDHPDIEEFINWKVIEEQKVAALVTGSKLLNRHLNAILKACHSWPEPEERFDRTPQRRPAQGHRRGPGRPGAGQLHRARHPAGPAGLHLAAHRGVRHRLELEGVLHRLRPEQQQLGAHRQRLHDAVQKDGPWHLYWRTEKEKAKREGRPPKPRKTLQARDLWDQIAYAAWSCADPGVQYRHHHQRMAHLPGGWPDQCVATRASEYMFLDDTACNLASLNLLKFYDISTRPIRRRFLPPRLPALDVDPGNLRLHGPVPQRAGGAEVLRFPHAGPGLRQPRLAADGAGHSLRFAGRPGAVRRAHGADARGLLRHVRRDGRRGRAVPALRGQPRGHAARHPQPSPGRLQRARRRVRGLDHHAGRHRPTPLPGLPAGSRPRANATGCSSLGEKHGYRNAQVTCIAPTGTIGLVMDCDTTGVEPDFALVKFKKLAGGGYFKIINASIPPALARLGYTPAPDRGHRPLLPGHGTLAGLPAHQPRHAEGQGLHRRGAAEDRSAACRASSSCRSSSIAGRSATISAATRSASSQEQLESPGFDLLAALGFTRQQIAEANALRLRHHDHRRGAAPEAGALSGLRLRQQVRQDRPALPVGRVAHPHDGGRPAVHLRGHFARRSTCRTRRRSTTSSKPTASSWQLMLKANALYRDGSKLSQPLNTVADGAGAEPRLEEPRARPEAGADRREDRPPLHRPPPPAARPPGRLHAEGPHRQPQDLPAHRRIRGRHARRDLPRHAQGRGRLPQHDQLLRHRRLARLAARRAAGRVRRCLPVHALRAERRGRRAIRTSR